METTHRVEQRTYNFANDTLWTLFGVIKEDVGHTMGDFAHCCTSNTSGKEVVVGGTVGLAEEFPREGTHHRVEEGNAIGESVLACRIVEHAAMKGMGELVA